jgi:hypothetical protein
MQLELPLDELKKLIAKQLDNFFIFDRSREQAPLNSGIETALTKSFFISCIIKKYVVSLHPLSHKLNQSLVIICSLLYN